MPARANGGSADHTAHHAVSEPEPLVLPFPAGYAAPPWLSPGGGGKSGKTHATQDHSIALGQPHGHNAAATAALRIWHCRRLRQCHLRCLAQPTHEATIERAITVTPTPVLHKAAGYSTRLANM